MARFSGLLCAAFLCGATLFARNSIILEPAELVDTQQTIFHSGGTLELKDSLGEVNIVGWDQPQMELTVTKSTHRRYAPEDMEKALTELDKIVVSMETAGNHVVVRTEFPAHTRVKANLQYTIHVPRQTRIIVRHQAGEVKVHDVAANMEVLAHSGGIQLELPELEQFVIDAQTRQGEVVSDWSLPAAAGLASPYRVTLRMDSGDISIHRARSKC